MTTAKIDVAGLQPLGKIFWGVNLGPCPRLICCAPLALALLLSLHVCGYH